MLNRDKIAIVLVEPQSPGNVGMVCRAMKNMGLTELRLVNPCPIDHPEALKFAVSAKDLLERAKIFHSLQEALADRELTVGTTRRFGKYRQEIITPEEVALRFHNQLGGNKGAIVFGREDNGLSTDELAQCLWHATIPTDEAYGSLNLAQAVLIFCYALSDREQTEGEANARTLAGTGEIEAFYGHMERTLLRIGFLNPENPDHIMRTLRRVFARAELDAREVAVLRGMMTQVDWATNEFKGKKG